MFATITGHIELFNVIAIAT